MEIWKTLRVSHIPTPPATTTDNCLTRRYTNIPLGTKDRSGQRSSCGPSSCGTRSAWSGPSVCAVFRALVVCRAQKLQVLWLNLPRSLLHQHTGISRIKETPNARISQSTAKTRSEEHTSELQSLRH